MYVMRMTCKLNGMWYGLLRLPRPFVLFQTPAPKGVGHPSKVGLIHSSYGTAQTEAREKEKIDTTPPKKPSDGQMIIS